jgi:hypothetical protein
VDNWKGLLKNISVVDKTPFYPELSGCFPQFLFPLSPQQGLSTIGHPFLPSDEMGVHFLLKLPWIS